MVLHVAGTVTARRTKIHPLGLTLTRVGLTKEINSPLSLAPDQKLPIIARSDASGSVETTLTLKEDGSMAKRARCSL